MSKKHKGDWFEELVMPKKVSPIDMAKATIAVFSVVSDKTRELKAMDPSLSMRDASELSLDELYEARQVAEGKPRTVK